jgi:hypothetical protein
MYICNKVKRNMLEWMRFDAEMKTQIKLQHLPLLKSHPYSPSRNEVTAVGDSHGTGS